MHRIGQAKTRLDWWRSLQQSRRGHLKGRNSQQLGASVRHQPGLECAIIHPAAACDSSLLFSILYSIIAVEPSRSAAGSAAVGSILGSGLGPLVKQASNHPGI